MMEHVNTYIALFRGINVGGNNILPMKELKVAMEYNGFRNVQTYIQSGNVVFQSEASDAPELAETITGVVRVSHGFAPNVLILNREDLERAIRENPFPEAEDEPKTLHLWFLKQQPENPDISKLESLKNTNERFSLREQIFYLNAPDGIGRSKLAEKVEKCLGVPATARNWRTVSRIAEIMQHYD